MNIFSIYKAINKKNNKVYIGFDSNWPDRKHAHKSSSFCSTLRDYNSLFHKAIRKHGFEAFEWEVICEHYDGEYTLNVLEPYFIDVYDSFGKNGYNMTKGGDGSLGRKLSKDSREKVSKGNKGKIRTEEFKNNISKTRTGFKHTNEAKKKISQAHKGRIHTKEAIENMANSRKGLTNNAKNYLLIDPEGKEYEIKNLKKFCTNNPQFNLNYKSFYNNRINYKNWKCIIS